MLTKKRLPQTLAIICCIEIFIYTWSRWTSTFPAGNFFAIKPEFIFDKCARIAGRISSVLILLNLWMVGYFGLRKIYSDEKKKESFLILLTLFTCNHLIHLLFVILRFRSHGESISIHGPVEIGGIIHGIITFASIIVVPIVLWKFQSLNKLLYTVIIVHLLNISAFIIKTFWGKVKPPEHPAYHNQFGIVVIAAACLYVLYKAYLENRKGALSN